MEGIAEVVNEITKINEYLYKNQNQNPEGISRAATRLAILNANLGVHLASLEQEVAHLDMSKKTCKISVYKTERDAKKSTRDAEMEADLAVMELQEDINKKEYEFKSIKNLHDNTWRLVSALQSRIKAQVSEQANTNII